MPAHRLFLLTTPKYNQVLPQFLVDVIRVTSPIKKIKDGERVRDVFLLLLRIFLNSEKKIILDLQ